MSAQPISATRSWRPEGGDTADPGAEDAGSGQEERLPVQSHQVNEEFEVSQ